MNVKETGIVPAVVVGVIVTVANVYISRSVDRDDSTTASLAELKTQVANLNSQVSKLAEQPYVRREEFEARAAGLDQRLGNIERAVFTGRQR